MTNKISGYSETQALYDINDKPALIDNRGISLLTEAEKQIDISNNNNISELSLDKNNISIYINIEGSDTDTFYQISSLYSEISLVLSEDMPKELPVSLVKRQATGIIKILPTIDEEISTKIKIADSNLPEAQIVRTSSIIDDRRSAGVRAGRTIISIIQEGGKLIIF